MARGKHEGSIRYDEGRERWVGKIQIQGKRHTVYGKTRREVLSKISELRQRYEQGLAVAPGKLTLGEYATGWLASIQPKLRPSTYGSYSWLYQHYIADKLGSTKLKDLRPDHIRMLYAQMQQQGLSANTIQRVHAVLRQILNQAVRDGLLARSPLVSVHAPRPQRQEMHVLSPEEARRFLAAAQDSRYHVLFAVALHTGMRQGELLALQWQDIDLDKGELYVRRQLDKTGSFAEPKTASSRRRIDLDGHTVALLRTHRARQLEWRLVAGSDWTDLDLVFCTPLGKPLSPRNVLRGFKLVLQKAGLPDLRFHDLRHTAASLMLLANVPAKTVAERLGHADISLTLQTYSHVLPTMQKQAAERLGVLLFGEA